MQRSKLEHNVVFEERIITDRLHQLLETLEEPEQRAVVASIHKLIDVFEGGMWKPAKR